MAYYESYIELALKEYQHPNVIKTELLELKTLFTDLRPKESTFWLNDGTNEELLNLDGTIPVKYKGQIYNIPVVIWLWRDYPDTPPMVYVNPTPSMKLMKSRIVQKDGKIVLPYLREWKFPGYDLHSLVQILTIVFGKEPPVSSYHERTKDATTQTDTREEGGQRLGIGLNVSPDYENDLLTFIERLKFVTEHLKQEINLGGYCYTIFPDIYIYFNHHNTTIRNYENHEQIKTDVSKVLTEFVDLDYTSDFFVYNDGDKRRLLKLTGTLPVKFKGTDIKVPISIWLCKTYPHNAPMVYVVPSLHMHVMSGNFVDADGKVQIPYLTEWQYPETDLLDLVHNMTKVFAEELPVRRKFATEDSVPGRSTSAEESSGFAGEVSGRRR